MKFADENGRQMTVATYFKQVHSVNLVGAGATQRSQITDPPCSGAPTSPASRSPPKLGIHWSVKRFRRSAYAQSTLSSPGVLHRRSW